MKNRAVSRILSLALAVVMVFMLLPGVTVYADDENVGTEENPLIITTPEEPYDFEGEVDNGTDFEEEVDNDADFEGTLASEIYLEFGNNIDLPSLMTFAAGDSVGTAGNPLIISTALELHNFAQKVRDDELSDEGIRYSEMYVELGADIDLSSYDARFDGGKGWIPIGTNNKPFMGDFDGGGHKITGLYINRIRDDYSIGLFAGVRGGTVKNLGIIDCDITGDMYVGGVAGYIEDNSRVENCYVTGSVKGTMSVGGLVGNVGNADALDYTGSIVTNCYVIGTVSGNEYVGGVVGVVSGVSSIENCYSAGAVKGIADDDGPADNTGGVAGYIGYKCSAENCYTTSSVSGDNKVGGVVGYVESDGIVESCYATGTVSGSSAVGGIVGYARSSVIIPFPYPTTIPGGKVTSCAALNPSVSASTANARRVVGEGDNTTQTNNNAYDDMTVTTGASTSTPSSGDDASKDGVNISGEDIIADGTLGDLFTDNGSPWTCEDGYLPGLFGNPVEMPDHIVSNTSPFAGGSGTEASPYKIKTPEQLAELATLVNAEDPTYNSEHTYYVMVKDIDLSIYKDGIGWTPIGTMAKPFMGTFDGGGHEITELFIDDNGEFKGLFGFVKGTVKNLGVAGCDINGKNFVGGVAGYVENGGEVKNCYATGTVNGTTNIGGIAGRVSGSVSYCYAANEVSGNDSVGGVVGFLANGSVTYCIALNPKVTASMPNAGRVVGYGGSTMSGNYAFTDIAITVDGNDKNISNTSFHNKADGADISAEEIITNGTLKDLFTISPWICKNGYLPGLYGNMVTIPAHIMPFTGIGTYSAPYEIETPVQLEMLALLINAGNPYYNDSAYEIIGNIDLSGYQSGTGWTPIGTRSNHFKGYIDGGDYEITGLYINRDSNYQGLFGYINEGIVENLVLAGCNVTGRNYVGGIVGELYEGEVKDCRVTGTVSGYDALSGNYNDIGGVAGSVWLSHAENCSFDGSVSGFASVGGVAGGIYKGSVEHCNTDGSVSGFTGVGGVAGSVNDAGSVEYCYSNSEVSGNSNIGGDNAIGGVVGNVNYFSWVYYCYATGAVSGDSYIGGVAGSTSSSEVADCYATGAVSGYFSVGGVVGYVDRYVYNCYATGAVSGYDNVGGVAGWAYDTVINCVALNPSVTASKPGADAGRVAGYQGSAVALLSGNYAYIGMTVTVDGSDKDISSTSTHDKVDGADLTKAQIANPDFWKGTTTPWSTPDLPVSDPDAQPLVLPVWNEAKWEFVQDYLPILVGVPGQVRVIFAVLTVTVAGTGVSGTSGTYRVSYSDSPRMFDVTVTGMEYLANPGVTVRINSAAIAAGVTIAAGVANGSATLTIPAKYSGTVTITTTLDNNISTVCIATLTVGGTNVTVSFNSNGGSGVMQSVSVPKGVYVLPFCSFTRGGYSFSGWKVNNSGNTLAAGTSITVSGDITLYAQWSYNGGGSRGDDSDDRSSGSGTTTPSQPNHNFENRINVYTKGSEIALVHITQKGFSRFSSVKVDGSTITKDKHYKAENSSTKITLFTDYLNTLSVGKHTLTVYFNDGVVVGAEFIIKERVSEELTPWINPFADVNESSWYYSDVEYVYTHGLMSGTSTETMLFSPDIPLTRGMIVSILHRKVGSPEISGLINLFGDVSEEKWYAEAVKWATANGIVSGYGNGKFGPEDSITRQDLAVILVRYANFAGIELPVKRNYQGFNDNIEIMGYAKSAVERCYSAEIISGKPGNIFDPKGRATRAEAAAMLHRLLFLETAKER